MWPNIIDEMIAGLPTNSAQRLELEKLRLKSANDDARIKALEAKLEALQPQHGLDADAGKILQFFFRSGRELSPKLVANQLGMAQGMVDHHFDSLLDREFIRQSRTGMTAATCGYSITAGGRAFIVKHGMS